MCIRDSLSSLQSKFDAVDNRKESEGMDQFPISQEAADSLALKEKIADSSAVKDLGNSSPVTTAAAGSATEVDAPAKKYEVDSEVGNLAAASEDNSLDEVSDVAYLNVGDEYSEMEEATVESSSSDPAAAGGAESSSSAPAGGKEKDVLGAAGSSSSSSSSSSSPVTTTEEGKTRVGDVAPGTTVTDEANSGNGASEAAAGAPAPEAIFEDNIEQEASSCKTSGLASLFAGFFRCPTNKSENLDSADNYEEPANAQNTSHEAGGGV